MGCEAESCTESTGELPGATSKPSRTINDPPLRTSYQGRQGHQVLSDVAPFWLEVDGVTRVGGGREGAWHPHLLAPEAHANEGFRSFQVVVLDAQLQLHGGLLPQGHHVSTSSSRRLDTDLVHGHSRTISLCRGQTGRLRVLAKTDFPTVHEAADKLRPEANQSEVWEQKRPWVSWTRFVLWTPTLRLLLLQLLHTPHPGQSRSPSLM